MAYEIEIPGLGLSGVDFEVVTHADEHEPFVRSLTPYTDPRLVGKRPVGGIENPLDCADVQLCPNCYGREDVIGGRYQADSGSMLSRLFLLVDVGFTDEGIPFPESAMLYCSVCDYSYDVKSGLAICREHR